MPTGPRLAPPPLRANLPHDDSLPEGVNPHSRPETIVRSSQRRAPARRPAPAAPPATAGRAVSRAASKAALQGGKRTVDGHQEFAIQQMVDFFARRPLERMMSAFRIADKDGSGNLDEEEFCTAVRNMKANLSDKDARALFAAADEDGSGSLSVDEFFRNFRHDEWPRERFFWDKALGGDGADISKHERKELAKKVDGTNAVPLASSTQTTLDVMRFLETKTRTHGGAERVFRQLDYNQNSTLDPGEIAQALRPFHIHLSDTQAANVLKEINSIAGTPADAELEYATFAAAFHPTKPPLRAGSVAFQPPLASALVATHMKPEDINYTSALGEPRTLDGRHHLPGYPASELPFTAQMRSIASLSKASSAARLDHSFARDASTTAFDVGGVRHDMLGAWRHEEAYYEGKDMLSKEHWRTNLHETDWYADNRGTGRESDWGNISGQDKAMLLNKLYSKSLSSAASMPSLAGGGAAGVAGAADYGMAIDGTSSIGSPKGIDAPLESMASSIGHPPPKGKGGPRMLSSSHSQSRIALAREAASSASMLEVLRPGSASHHHIGEAARLKHTSSLASLRSISAAHLEGKTPVGTEHPMLEERKSRVQLRLEQSRQRHESWRAREEQNTLETEARAAAIVDARSKIKAANNQRFANQQLVQQSRYGENGVAPVLLEAGPTPKWAPAPPHLSSHWTTISCRDELTQGPLGTSAKMDDPRRGKEMLLQHGQGRRVFADRLSGDVSRESRRPGMPTWGGDMPPLVWAAHGKNGE